MVFVVVSFNCKPMNTKKLNLVSSKNWNELENEVDRLNQKDTEYKSAVGMLTDDEIAVLANEMNNPKSIHELRNHHQSSTPLSAKADEALHESQKSYMHKQSILRKLMIAQRKKFIMKKEQADMNKLRKKLNDTSVSNFSQASEYFKCSDAKKSDNVK